MARASDRASARASRGSRAWRLAAFALFALFTLAGFSRPARSIEASDYATSESCRECHPELYRQWKMTSHARMLRNAKEIPSAIEADNFTDEIPFTKDDIDFTLGSHWIQKYLTKIDGEMYILPKFWNVVEKEWEPYSIWNWRSRPYSHHCNWCHSVGYDTDAKTFVEESIGCESCHGPGKKHTESEEADDIVNPAKLSKERADMICESCHTDGKDKRSKTYPFPDGYIAGEDLTEHYTDFFMPKPGSKGWYQGTTTYEERHRMFLFWQSRFYSNARSCEVCEFDRGLSKEAKKGSMTRDKYCSTCHTEIFKDAKGHSKHSLKDARCVDCHTPLLDATGLRYSIHDHKFDFSGPKIPCAECHGKETPVAEGDYSHEYYRFGPVGTKKNLTVEQTCERCHDGAVPGSG